MFLRVLVGSLTALAAWAILEPSAPKDLSTSAWDSWELSFILALGVLVGGGIGGVNGLLTGGKVHIFRGLALGAVFGAVGISIGYKLGILISALAVGANWAASGNIVFMIVGRLLALTPMGAMLGFGIGASTLSAKRAKHGLIGGALGGLIGAGVFDIVGQVIGGAVLMAKGVQPGAQAEVGQLSRALYAIALGAGIALFISLVENMAKSAWVRMRLGRNEGREWPIYGDTTTLGRSEAANIPIFGDPAIQPFHAAIVRQPGGYMIVDNGGGVLLNGQPVAQAPIYSGANIQIGQTILEFITKDGAVPLRPADMAGYRGYPMQPAPAPYPQPTQPAAALQPTVIAPAPAMSMPTQAAPAVPTLVAMDGPLMGQRFAIAQSTELGRESTAIPLSFDSSASRRHASVAPAPGGLAVNDLGSTNGVFVNGQRVQSALVPPGGTLKIGSTTFLVE